MAQWLGAHLMYFWVAVCGFESRRLPKFVYIYPLFIFHFSLLHKVWKQTNKFNFQCINNDNRCLITLHRFWQLILELILNRLLSSNDALLEFYWMHNTHLLWCYFAWKKIDIVGSTRYLNSKEKCSGRKHENPGIFTRHFVSRKDSWRPKKSERKLLLQNFKQINAFLLLYSMFFIFFLYFVTGKRKSLK